jgi:hypothetical protein
MGRVVPTPARPPIVFRCVLCREPCQEAICSRCDPGKYGYVVTWCQVCRASEWHDDEGYPEEDVEPMGCFGCYRRRSACERCGAFVGKTLCAKCSELCEQCWQRPRKAPNISLCGRCIEERVSEQSCVNCRRARKRANSRCAACDSYRHSVDRPRRLWDRDTSDRAVDRELERRPREIDWMMLGKR